MACDHKAALWTDLQLAVETELENLKSRLLSEQADILQRFLRRQGLEFDGDVFDGDVVDMDQMIAESRAGLQRADQVETPAAMRADASQRSRCSTGMVWGASQQQDPSALTAFSSRRASSLVVDLRSSLPIDVGSAVVVQQHCKSALKDSNLPLSAQEVDLQKGLLGVVKKLDGEGRALVEFEDHPEPQWVWLVHVLQRQRRTASVTPSTSSTGLAESLPLHFRIAAFTGVRLSGMGMGGSILSVGSEEENAGLPTREEGVLHRILNSAANGKAKRDISSTDKRPFLVRWRTCIVEWTLIIIIAANTVTLGVQLEVGSEKFDWLPVNAAFAAVFTLEMLVKMGWSGFRQFFCGTDLRCRLRADADLRWRFMEAFLVLTAIVEVLFVAIGRARNSDPASTSQIGRSSAAFRLIRLCRIFRMLRVARLQFFSDLIMMISGAIGGNRILAWSVVLVSVPVYIMAVIYHELLGEEQGLGADYFGSTAHSWFTMFNCLVVSECVDHEGRPLIPLLVKHYGWGYGATYLLAKVTMCFGLFNVITAHYVENSVAAAKFNDVRQKRQRLRDAQMFADKTKALVDFIWKLDQSYGGNTNMKADDTLTDKSHLDIDHILRSIQMTPEFLEYMQSFQEFSELLLDLDVSNEDQIDLFDTLDVDASGTVDLEELVWGICKLRGDARRSDIVGVSLIVRNLQKELSRFDHMIKDIRKSQMAMTGETVRSIPNSSTTSPKQFRNRGTARIMQPESLTPGPPVSGARRRTSGMVPEPAVR